MDVKTLLFLCWYVGVLEPGKEHLANFLLALASSLIYGHEILSFLATRRQKKQLQNFFQVAPAEFNR